MLINYMSPRGTAGPHTASIIKGHTVDEGVLEGISNRGEIIRIIKGKFKTTLTSLNSFEMRIKEMQYSYMSSASEYLL